MSVKKIRTLGVIGVGLIGGSFALALKHQGLVGKVLGAGKDDNSLGLAKALGIIDEVVTIAEMATLADVIVIAAPVNAFEGIAIILAPLLPTNTIVSDVGSTKAKIIEIARQVFADKIHQFVPAHPIAGSHASGPTAAISDLFQDKNVIITPLQENSPEAVALIQSLWESCGATVQLLKQAKDHDDIYAAVSHFPHFLAACYMSFMESDPVRQKALNMGGTGFRDFTRIAAGSPEMWRDIFLSNQEAMLSQMRDFEKEFNYFKQLLENKDAEQLYQWLSVAAKARQNWKVIKN